MTVCAISLKKFVSALASPVLSGLIAWGITRTERASVASFPKLSRKKNNNAAIYSVIARSKQWHYKWRLNERKGSEYIKHFGDITQLSGHELPIVDCIIGGSPCQDLSVAGKRAGLAGERSGLFMEQMRIVKEMRERDVQDNGRSGFMVRPRYLVWENVPGAFSSGKPKGSDFAAVIEEIIKVAEPDACVQVCVPDGGWTKSGCYYSADGKWSIAWRLHDAQFWGVPQRRKRIALVADFGGLSAPEVLFERKGLRWDSEQSAEEGQGTAE